MAESSPEMLPRISMPRLGLGTYQLGPQTYDVCRQALDMGYRHLDTAALYRNEAAVARAVEQSGILREEIFLVTKIERKDLSPDKIIPAARRCMETLGRIDLLLLHAPTENPAACWETLQEAGAWPEIGALGVSNFDVGHLHGLIGPQPVCNQIETSPFLPRQELRLWCQQRGIQVAAHSPLTKGARLHHPVLGELADALEITTAQILIAWSLSRNDAVIPRTSNPERLRENLEAMNIALPEEALSRLDALEDGFATHPQHVK